MLMSNKINISVIRADEIDEDTREWCLSLVIQSIDKCKEDPSTETTIRETGWELTRSTNGIIIASSSSSSADKSSLDTTTTVPTDHSLQTVKLPVMHQAEEAPKKKRSRKPTTETRTTVKVQQEFGEIEGFILFDYDDIDMEPEEGFCAYIIEIHVRPESRSKGIGAILLSSLENIAIEAGASCLKLTSMKKNKDALKFYYKHGFVLDPDSPAKKFHVPYVILRKTFIKTEDKKQVNKT